MDNKLNVESLLEANNTEEMEDVMESLIDQQSLLNMGDNETMSDTSVLTTEEGQTKSGTMSLDKEVERKKEEMAKREELRRQFEKTPEYKAAVVFQNHVKSIGRPMSGKELRALRRECLRNAKKGKYDKFFSKEYIERQAKRQQEKFAKMNKPTVHTVEEIPEDAQKRMLEMMDEEPWHDSAPQQKQDI